MKVEVIGNKIKHHITIDALSMQKIEYILKSNYNNEFTVFMHCDRNTVTGEHHIYDTFFPEQKNSPAFTECDSEDVMELVKEGADIEKLCGHCHSHSQLSVFASTTDKSEIIERADFSGFNAAIIVNKKGEIFGHITDIDLGLYLSEVPVKIKYENSNFEEVILKALKEAVSIEHAKEILKITEWEWYKDTNPLTEIEKEELNLTIKSKFKSSFGSTNYNYPVSKSYQKTKSYISPKKQKKIDEMTEAEWWEFISDENS